MFCTVWSLVGWLARLANRPASKPEWGRKARIDYKSSNSHQALQASNQTGKIWGQHVWIGLVLILCIFRSCRRKIPAIEYARRFTRRTVEQRGLCPIRCPKNLLHRPGRLASRPDSRFGKRANRSEHRYIYVYLLCYNVVPSSLGFTVIKEWSRKKPLHSNIVITNQILSSLAYNVSNQIGISMIQNRLSTFMRLILKNSARKSQSSQLFNWFARLSTNCWLI